MSKIEPIRTWKGEVSRAVLRIRILEPVLFWPLDLGSGMEKNPEPGSGIWDEHPGSYFE